MKNNRFREDQIIAVLKDHKAGFGVTHICRKHRISDTTFYNWRSRYGGRAVSGVCRLNALDNKNRKPKKPLAESIRDVATLREAFVEAQKDDHMLLELDAVGLALAVGSILNVKAEGPSVPYNDFLLAVEIRTKLVP